MLRLHRNCNYLSCSALKASLRFPTSISKTISNSASSAFDIFIYFYILRKALQIKVALYTANFTLLVNIFGIESIASYFLLELF